MNSFTPQGRLRGLVTAAWHKHDLDLINGVLPDLKYVDERQASELHTEEVQNELIATGSEDDVRAPAVDRPEQRKIPITGGTVPVGTNTEITDGVVNERHDAGVQPDQQKVAGSTVRRDQPSDIGCAKTGHIV